MKYAVYMNSQFINSFTSYSKACELEDWLRRTFKNAIIEIEPEY